MSSTEKIVSLDQLKDICRELQSSGKKIVHCHGCFDLLHLGHMKYFESAKKMGDILVVTVTEDRFVKGKGPNRPFFSQELRAEAIASLEAVDYVAINKWETAVETIELLRPDFYVKGSDYKNAADDLTGNISLEADAVHRIGGEIRFTEDIMFSSGYLLNRFFPIYTEDINHYLNNIKKKFSVKHIINALDSFSDLRVLVIGDIILDEYNYCEPKGIVGKDPIISTRYKDGETYLGGSLAIANHLSSFVKKVELVGVIGDKNDYESFIYEGLLPNVVPSLFMRKDTYTSVKARYISPFKNVKLFKIEYMDDEPIEPQLEEKIIQHLESVIDSYDIVLVADFGHGLLTGNIRRFLEKRAAFLAVNAQTNSANHGFNYITNYKKANFISIDKNELQLSVSERKNDIAALVAKLSKEIDCPSFTITLGTEGISYFQNREEYFGPVLSKDVVDSVGAGDAVLSILTLAAYREVEPELIPFIGNSVGALAIRIMGNRESITKSNLIRFISGALK